MNKTKLAQWVQCFIYRISNTCNTKINTLSLSILYMLLGFFISNALSTIPGQTGDWGIIAAAIIVTVYERISQYTYPLDFKKGVSQVFVNRINYIKIGILYGLFVDAFKLGS
uniref:Uncharacterized protein ycf20 n=1 Tax=Hommersandiophycus borowitzkae TaxID=268573 RepID=A0A1G4NUE9_9FLOR|nr:Hypothetical protein ycf20 [Hommersandiophycus borowitzkae]SCW22129.1 Hypothetical protein ycf20 [Hommersandiophycus borowitzkae]